MQVDPSKQKKSETGGKRRFLPFFEELKRTVWPFFATLLKDMERGGSYTYEVSSKTNAKVQIKTERFKIES